MDLISLPFELLSTILMIYRNENGFSVLYKLCRLNSFFHKFIHSNFEFWVDLDLELQVLDHDVLKDGHIYKLLMQCSPLASLQIVHVNIYGNSSLTHSSILAIFTTCINLSVLDCRHCYNVDIMSLEVATRSLTPPSCQRLKRMYLSHIGSHEKYYCGPSLSQESQFIKSTVFGAAMRIERNLGILSFSNFSLDSVPCSHCFQRLCVENTPICEACFDPCPRVCDQCEALVYRKCCECDLTVCIKCDGGHSLKELSMDASSWSHIQRHGTPHFVYPDCSLSMCLDHHGNRESASKTVCRTGCLVKPLFTCFHCGFWACPRSRECDFERGVLERLNRIVSRCDFCQLGTCGVCLQNQIPCKECGTSCIYCMKTMNQEDICFACSLTKL